MYFSEGSNFTLVWNLNYSSGRLIISIRGLNSKGTVWKKYGYKN